MKLIITIILFCSTILIQVADEIKCKDLKTKKQCLKNESCIWLNSKEICKYKNSNSETNEKNLRLKNQKRKKVRE